MSLYLENSKAVSSSNGGVPIPWAAVAGQLLLRKCTVSIARIPAEHLIDDPSIGSENRA